MLINKMLLPTFVRLQLHPATLHQTFILFHKKKVNVVTTRNGFPGAVWAPTWIGNVQAATAAKTKPVAARRPNRKFIGSPLCVFKPLARRMRCNCKLFARRLTDHNASVKLVANELQLGSSKPEKPVTVVTELGLDGALWGASRCSVGVVTACWAGA